MPGSRTISFLVIARMQMPDIVPAAVAMKVGSAPSALRAGDDVRKKVGCVLGGSGLAEQGVKRRLAAILAADVVGYGSLMGRDEEGARAALRMYQAEVLDPIIAKHSGRIFKAMGDGFLVEFASVLNAARCAVDIQETMARGHSARLDRNQMMFRIGVNLGDVMVEGDDLHGDGVNVAVRIEGVADPGGICVAGVVHEQVRRKLDVQFEDLGAKALKGIAEPVQLFAIRLGTRRPVPLQLPDKPSIAVLPFVNMSADPEYEYFVDGLTEDLITDLSCNSGLFVIARNSTFAYKGKPTDVRQIAKDLGVRYLLEGSTRRAGGRVRINVQLIDCIGGGHVWAERFDSDMQDIFDLQDAVTARIVKELIGQLIAPAAKRPTASIEAYDLCLQGRVLIANGPGNPAALHEGVATLERALQLDPTYAEPHRWIAFSCLSRWVHGAEPEGPFRKRAVEHSRAAVALDPADAGNHWVLAYVLSYEQMVPEFEAAFAKSLELDQNNADAWIAFADISAVQGKLDRALDAMERALRLQPHPPSFYFWIQGFILYCDRQYDAAVGVLRRPEVYGSGARRILAASLAQLGQMDDARREAELFTSAAPGFTVANWLSMHAYGDPRTLAHYADGCRKAGIPG